MHDSRTTLEIVDAYPQLALTGEQVDYGIDKIAEKGAIPLMHGTNRVTICRALLDAAGVLVSDVIHSVPISTQKLNFF